MIYRVCLSIVLFVFLGTITYLENRENPELTAAKRICKGGFEWNVQDGVRVCWTVYQFDHQSLDYTEPEPIAPLSQDGK